MADFFLFSESYMHINTLKTLTHSCKLFHSFNVFQVEKHWNFLFRDYSLILEILALFWFMDYLTSYLFSPKFWKNIIQEAKN
jgi:hypothetical protein